MTTRKGTENLAESIKCLIFAYNDRYVYSVLDSLSSRVSELKVNFDKMSQECDALKQAILRQVFE